MRTRDRRVDGNNSLPFSVITISSFSLFRVSLVAYLSRFRYIISLPHPHQRCIPCLFIRIALSFSRRSLPLPVHGSPSLSDLVGSFRGSERGKRERESSNRQKAMRRILRSKQERERTREGRVGERGRLGRIIKRNGHVGCDDQFALFFRDFPQRHCQLQCPARVIRRNGFFDQAAGALDCDSSRGCARVRARSLANNSGTYTHAASRKIVARIKSDKGNVFIETAPGH